MQTVIFRMDKQPGPLYSTGTYIQSPEIDHDGKEYLKNVCTCIIESLCYTAEVGTIL